MLEKIPAVLGQALGSVRPGLESLIYARAELAAPESVSISSDAFAHETAMPSRFTNDGATVSPPLRFGAIPTRARSLALIVEDADSPTPAPLCHLLAWNIVAEDGGLQESALNGDSMPTTRCGAIFGKNSFLSLGWLAPDPPTGHGPHRYAFQVYALDVTLELEEGAGRGALVEAITGHVVAKGLLIGTYERPA